MATVSRKFSPTHTRGARTVSPTIEGRRADALRLMSIGGVVCSAGAIATFWVIKHPSVELLFVAGWLAIAFGGLAFFRGLWMFVRD
jgi:hypothetical protein